MFVHIHRSFSAFSAARRDRRSEYIKVFEWMGKCFLVVRRQDSGTVRAGPNRILKFPLGRNLFILHRPLNTGMGWTGP